MLLTNHWNNTLKLDFHEIFRESKKIFSYVASKRKLTGKCLDAGALEEPGARVSPVVFVLVDDLLLERRVPARALHRDVGRHVAVVAAVSRTKRSSTFQPLTAAPATKAHNYFSLRSLSSFRFE